MKLIKKLVLPAVAGILIGGMVACDREGPLERAGERVDKTAERAGDRAERAVN
jgi:hypothetical protein